MAPLSARVAIIVAGTLAAAGLVALGRVTADTRPADASGYLAGLQEGRAQGLAEGRALEVGESLPPGSRQRVRAAFETGYADGANDVFAGYDGGWSLSAPYLITLARGRGPIAYRIDSRTPIRAEINYYRCPPRRALCEESRD